MHHRLSKLRRPAQSRSHRSGPTLLSCMSASKPRAVPLGGMRVASVDPGLPGLRSICLARAVAFFRVFRDASGVLGCTFPFHVMDIAATSNLGANSPKRVAARN